MAQHVAEQPVERGDGHELGSLDGRAQGGLLGVPDPQVQLHGQGGVDPLGPNRRPRLLGLGPQNRPPGPDVVTGLGPGLDETPVLEDPARLENGGQADPELVPELADRRDPVARSVGPRLDLVGQGVGQLQVEAPGGIQIQWHPLNCTPEQL